MCGEGTFERNIERKFNFFNGALSSYVKIVVLSSIFSFQVTDKSHFMNELGLDSLDCVELVMAIEGSSLKNFFCK